MLPRTKSRQVDTHVFALFVGPPGLGSRGDQRASRPDAGPRCEAGGNGLKGAAGAWWLPLWPVPSPTRMRVGSRDLGTGPWRAVSPPRGLHLNSASAVSPKTGPPRTPTGPRSRRPQRDQADTCRGTWGPRPRHLTKQPERGQTLPGCGGSCGTCPNVRREDSAGAGRPPGRGHRGRKVGRGRDLPARRRGRTRRPATQLAVWPRGIRCGLPRGHAVVSAAGGWPGTREGAAPSCAQKVTSTGEATAGTGGRALRRSRAGRTVLTSSAHTCQGSAPRLVLSVLHGCCLPGSPAGCSPGPSQPPTLHRHPRSPPCFPLRTARPVPCLSGSLQLPAEHRVTGSAPRSEGLRLREDTTD